MELISTRIASLGNASAELLITHQFRPYVTELVELVHKQELSVSSVREVLVKNQIRSIEDIKPEMLDVVLAYVAILLKKFYITEEERAGMVLLKRAFHIHEGDMLRYRKRQIRQALEVQFDAEYANGRIDPKECVHNSILQELFDLGYDQFDAFKEKEILEALDRGADIAELDTALQTKAVSGKIISMRKKLMSEQNGKSA